MDYEYVAAGYWDEDYTQLFSEQPNDTVYVDSGYWLDHYTVATLRSAVNISGVANAAVTAQGRFVGETVLSGVVGMSASPVKTVGAVAELVESGDEGTWETMLSWAEPYQGVWQKRVYARAVRLLYSSSTGIITASVTVAGATTVRSTLTVEDLATLNAVATKITRGSITLNSSITVAPVPSATLTVGSATLNSVSSLTTAAFIKVRASAILNAATTAVSAGGRIRPFFGVVAAVSAMSVDAKRIRSSTATLDIAGAQLITAIRYQRFSATLNCVTNTATSGARRRTSSITLNNTVTTATNGGKLKGVSDFEFNIISEMSRAQGRLVRVDPYRRIRPLIETRTRIVGKEHRDLTVFDELRVSITNCENRIIQVLSEDRVWLIRRGTPTIVREIPYQEERL